jgi:heptosyltransferase-1
MRDAILDPALAAILGTPKLRVLIVRIGAMGDVLHGMPAVAGLRNVLPDCTIGWAIEPRWAPLLRSESGELPLVDRVHLVPTKQWKRRPLSPTTWREIARLRRDLHAERYDLCFDLQGSIKSALVGRMAGARWFLGYDLPREMEARFFYSDRIGVTQPNVIDQACELISGGIAKTVQPARVELPFDLQAESWCNSLPFNAQRFALLAPTAGWGAKEWGARRFAELAQRLASAGLRVLINAPPDTASPVAEEIARNSGATVVPSTIAQMIAVTRRAALVVGGDTGPMHLAAALGVPTVALFGPTDPERNGPEFPGAQVRWLRHERSVTSYRRHPETETGLASIRVEEVLQACFDLLGANHGLQADDNEP